MQIDLHFLGVPHMRMRKRRTHMRAHTHTHTHEQILVGIRKATVPLHENLATGAAPH